MKTFLNYFEILFSVEVSSPVISPSMKISKTCLSPSPPPPPPFILKNIGSPDFVEFKNPVPPLSQRGRGHYNNQFTLH